MLPRRRRVDWRLTMDGPLPRARLVSPSAQAAELAEIASRLRASPSTDAVDRALRRVVELAREDLELERTAIFLLDPEAGTMVGTWGTGETGATTDEHAITFALDEPVRGAFARAAQGYPWSVYEGCPLFAHDGGRTRVLRQGWVACTPILGGCSAPLGMMFNDTAITAAPLDEARQARAAVLCQQLGRALEPCRAALPREAPDAFGPSHPLVREASQLLARNPGLSFRAVAEQLRVSPGYLTRTFKRYRRTSIVEYRNGLRLAQFLERVNHEPADLLDAALSSGFGSYAQFHRVFRERFGQGPRRYLYEHRQPLTEPPGARSHVGERT